MAMADTDASPQLARARASVDRALTELSNLRQASSPALPPLLSAVSDLEECWMDMMATAAVNREYTDFVYRAWLAVRSERAGDSLLLPLLTMVAAQASHLACACATLKCFPCPSVARTLDWHLLTGANALPPQVATTVLQVGFALHTRQRLWSDTLDLFRVLPHRRSEFSTIDALRDKHAALTGQVAQWIVQKANVEVTDASCRDYRARVYSQSLLPGVRYAYASVNPGTQCLVKLGTQGVVEGSIFARVHSPTVVAKLAALLSESPATRLLPTPAPVQQQVPTQEDHTSESIPLAVQGVVRDMAALTIFDTHFRVATRAAFSDRLILLSDHTTLARVGVTGKLRRRSPLIASVLVDAGTLDSDTGLPCPRVGYCVVEGQRVVTLGSNCDVVNSFEGAVALWLMVVRLLHGNTLSCGRSLQNFTRDLDCIPAAIQESS